MKAIGSRPEVIRLALDLGLSARGDCAGALHRYALQRVSELTKGFAIPTLPQLRSLLAERLSVRLEYLEGPGSVAALVEEFGNYDQHLDRLLELEFIDGETEGLLLRHPHPLPGDREYLALIDKRGDRAARACFTAWHELAHLLLTPRQMTFTGFRRTPTSEEIAKDPVESLVDDIAGRIAFYEPIFMPVLDRAISLHGGLTLKAIEGARLAADPAASFVSAAIASLRLKASPACFVQVDLGLKKSELLAPGRAARVGYMPLVSATRREKLRVLKVMHGGQRDDRVPIFRNIRVPPASILYRAYFDRTTVDSHLEALENLDFWETSSSGPLPSLRVRVEACQRGPYCYGLITPC